jgi:hypothetical protein
VAEAVSQLNELGGVSKPLAFGGQCGELGPGFEHLLDEIAEEGALNKRPNDTSSVYFA